MRDRERMSWVGPDSFRAVGRSGTSTLMRAWSVVIRRSVGESGSGCAGLHPTGLHYRASSSICL